MKYALLGDIHSNWEALSAVLEDAESQGVDRYACVGDVVGYNADPGPCLDRLRDLDAITVRGNHDHYCANHDDLPGFHPLAADVINWTRDRLSADQVAFLQGLPYSHRMDGFTLVHSTLDNPEAWGYVFDKWEADANFTYQSTAVCFFGHTHVPLAFKKRAEVTFGPYEDISITLGRKYFINVGSVGQPRDGDWRAAYATYDLATRKVEIHRLEYDVKKAQHKIRAAGLPSRLADRLASGC